MNYANPFPFFPAPQNPFGNSMFGGGGSLWDQYYQENPQAAYAQYMQGQGRGGTSRRDQWFGNQYGRLYNQYLGDLPNRPLDFKWTNYLQEKGPNLEREFNKLTPYERGENPSLYGGRVRYVGF